ncbi:MAG: DUF2974 domain-containing protein [Lachnospiraceae bacterium]|nr:DUF2974 domain-containing protein [Lachnospiraceae bacterium]
MDSIYTYLRYRKDISFNALPLNEIDILIFNVLAYQDFSWIGQNKMRLKDAANLYLGRKNVDPTLDSVDFRRSVLTLAAFGKRYENVYIERPVKDINEEEIKTFYAITFHVMPFTTVVAFRGTDDSILSWKENFTFFYKNPTQGETDSLNYLFSAMKNPFNNVIVSGHSKGGFLALYAAMNIPGKLKKRIKNIYLFDAPGIPKDYFDEKKYNEVKDRIKAYVPTTCVVGNLFNPIFEKTIVQGTGAPFVMHDIINWYVGPDGFETAKETDEFSHSFSDSLNGIIASVTPEEREDAISEIFKIFEAAGIKAMSDFNKINALSVFNGIAAYTQASAGAKNFIKTFTQMMLKQKK